MFAQILSKQLLFCQPINQSKIFLVPGPTITSIEIVILQNVKCQLYRWRQRAEHRSIEPEAGQGERWSEQEPALLEEQVRRHHRIRLTCVHHQCE